MGKGLSIFVVVLVFLVTSGVSLAGDAATGAWQPSVFQEFKVFESQDAWAPTPAAACDAFKPEAEAAWVGWKTYYGGGLTSVVVRVSMSYVAPIPGVLSPPGECKVRMYRSFNGSPASLDGAETYFFGHRGRYYLVIPRHPPGLGHEPARKNSTERNNTFVGEPVNITTGNVYHAETLTVGSGDRAVHFRRYYNSQSTDSGPFGANRRMSFSQSIQVNPLSRPANPSPSSFEVSGVYDTPSLGCSEGWHDIRASLDQAWAAGSYAHIRQESGRCVIFYNNGSRVYDVVPLSSPLTTQAYYPGSSPIPEVRVVRPDGARFRLRQINGRWVNDKGTPDRLEEITDANGTRTAWRYTTDEKTVETYDANGRLLSIQAINGLTKTLIYDGVGRLIKVRSDAGYSLSFSYDDQDRISTLTDNAGRVWSYSYDYNNNLAEVHQPDGTSRFYHYGDTRFPHALTDITDERGIDYIRYAYDQQGRGVLSTLADNAGRVDITYDDVNGTRTVTNGEGVTSTYAVNKQNGVPLVTQVDGPACPRCGSGHYSASFGGSTNALVADTQDGITTKYGGYDGKGNPGYRIEAYGTARARRTDYTFDSRFLSKVTSKTTASVADGRDKITQYQYDDYGNLTRKVVSGYTPSGTPVSRTITYAYDGPFHQLSRVDGPRTDVKDVTRYTYDNQGNIIQVTDALGNVTAINEHDALGRPLTVTDPNGLVTHLAYDTLGRLVLRNAGGEKTTFSYDAAGDLSRITLPDGSYLAYSYDNARRLVGVADQLGNRITYTLDTRGNRIEEDRYDTDHNLTRTRSQVYNDLNQLSQVIGAQGQVTAYGYDAHGNRRAETDPLDHVTIRSFDAVNRLVKSTNALGGAVDYAYNSQDHLTQVVDADANVTSYVYDDLGNRLQVESPDSGVTDYRYDGAGNVTSKTDAKGDTTHYTYDALNRITGVSYADGSTTTYTYDTAPNGIGRLVAVNDSTGITQWKYDLHGRVVEKLQSVGSVTLTTQYRYDSYGRLAEMIYPSGNVIGYRYANGLLNALTVDGHPLIKGIRYRPFGPVTAWTWGNGTPYARRYDLDGRLTSLSLPIGIRTLSFDRASRITGMSDPRKMMSFSYDSTNRLTQVIGGPADQTFQYDPNGNRTKLTQGSAVTTYTYDANSNRLLGQSGAVDKVYTYDANGSITSDGTRTYAYDARNRLVSIDNGAASYGVNALGQRVRKITMISEPPGDANEDDVIDSADFNLTVNVIIQKSMPTGNVDCNRDNQVNVQDLVCINIARSSGMLPTTLETTFVYGEGNKVIGEYNNNGEPLEETVYLKNLPVATIQSHRVYYVYHDHLGAPLAITDTANVTLWRWDRMPFGGTGADEDPDGDENKFIYPLRLPGQYFDKESDLNYNYFREYDPGTGRYWESDPVGLIGGLTGYAYVASSPLQNIDPYGLWTGVDDLLFAGGGALVGLVGQAIGDLISGKPSRWKKYTAAAVGGAVGGESLLYTGNPLIAGGAGGLTTNLITQGIEAASGKRRCLSWGSSLADAAIGTVTGLVPGPGRLLPGITAGRGSYSAVTKQITTKLRNGQIGNVSMKTAAKIIISKIAEGLPGSGAAGVAAIPVSSRIHDCGCQGSN